MKKGIAIDADHILYALASPQGEQWQTSLKGRSIKPKKGEMKKLKAAFMEVILEYEAIAVMESIGDDWKIGKTHIVISDESNFRYDVLPDYKANRQGREHTEQFIKLREWARKKWAPKQNLEADDVVAHLVRKGAIGFSGDKDLLKGVAGTWFDVYKTRRYWVYTSKAAAEKFNYLQYLAGDLTDGIQGIHGVGLVKAETLLNKYGWTWDGVLAAYKQHGLTKHDAMITRRLVSMTQWSPKKGLKLYGE